MAYFFQRFFFIYERTETLQIFVLEAIHTYFLRQILNRLPLNPSMKKLFSGKLIVSYGEELFQEVEKTLVNESLTDAVIDLFGDKITRKRIVTFLYHIKINCKKQFI